MPTYIDEALTPEQLERREAGQQKQAHAEEDGDDDEEKKEKTKGTRTWPEF